MYKSTGPLPCEVDFKRCERMGGAGAGSPALAHCEAVDFTGCKRIPPAAWRR